jgi:hypothetical protein
MTTTEVHHKKHKREPFHVRREISLGHMVSTIALAVAGVVFIMKMDTRIALLENILQAQNDRLASYDLRIEKYEERESTHYDNLRVDIRVLGDRIEDKLDGHQALEH